MSKAAIQTEFRAAAGKGGCTLFALLRKGDCPLCHVGKGDSPRFHTAGNGCSPLFLATLNTSGYPPRKSSCGAVALIAGILAAVLGLAWAAQAAEGPAKADAAASKIRLLILSGANNHSWKTTTPALKKIYEESGRFTVDVTEDVPNLKPADFARYDCIVSNYTTYPVIEGKRWPAETEKALLDYVSSGHGFVLFHAASTAWGDWPEFTDLIGLSWQKDKATGRNVSGHGAQHSFALTIVDKQHPITQGMKDFQHVKDELYHRQLKHPTARVLATTFSDKAKSGSGENEPMIVVTQLGKGRCFHNALGHDPKPMEGAGFQTLMLRGTEWAATGKVTIPIPADWPALGTPQAEELKKAAEPKKAEPAKRPAEAKK